MKFLLAVDGSVCAEHAVAQLIAQIGAWRALPEVHLLYVQPPIPVGRVQAHIGHDTLESYYRDESLPHLAAAEAALAAAGVVFSRHIHVGEAADVIAHLAAELGCDWIIMGNQGRSAVADAVLGSVAHRVLHLAHCPVLLVK